MRVLRHPTGIPPAARHRPRSRPGLIALVALALFAYFGFTKANPFANPYELNAVFKNTNRLAKKLAGADRRGGRGQGRPTSSPSPATAGATCG